MLLLAPFLPFLEIQLQKFKQEAAHSAPEFLANSPTSRMLETAAFKCRQ